MHHGLQRRDPSDMAMEQVERREAPACRPDKYIIPSSKEPEKWQIGNGQDASPVCYISQELFVYRGPAVPSVTTQRSSIE